MTQVAYQPEFPSVQNGTVDDPNFTLPSHQPTFVTPEMASHLLVAYAYDRQRAVRQGHVEMLAEAIRSSVFEASSITLVYCAETGKTHLADGQHRLHAIVRAQRSTPLYIIHRQAQTQDEVADIYGRLDRGVARTVGDVLRVHRLAEEVELPPSAVERIGTAMPIIRSSFAASAQAAALDRLGDLRIQMIREWIGPISTYYEMTRNADPGLSRRLWTGPVAAVGLVTVRYQQEAAAAFWRTVAANDALHKGTPERTLADFLAAQTIARQGRGRAMRGTAACWNAAFQGRALSKVQVSDDRAPIFIAGTPYRGKQ